MTSMVVSSTLQPRGENGRRPRIVIVTPVFNEEESLPFYEREVRTVFFSDERYDFHVLFVEDGSTDRSWTMIREICQRDSHFEGIRLSRNFGSHVALAAGFAHTRGDAFAVLACDLQDPPQVILEFLEEWRKGYHVVWGRRRTRQDKKWRVWLSRLFVRLGTRFAVPRGSQFVSGSFFLMDEKVAECYREYTEHNPITFALVAWTGFDQSVVDYDRRQRGFGKSGWSVTGMIKALYDTFLGFSSVAIQLITMLGISVSALAFLLLVYLVFLSMTKTPVPGWTSLMLALSFFFGLQFFLMGILGEYLSRIYREVIGRPRFFVSDRIGNGPEAEHISWSPLDGARSETGTLLPAHQGALVGELKGPATELSEDAPSFEASPSEPTSLPQR